VERRKNGDLCKNKQYKSIMCEYTSIQLIVVKKCKISDFFYFLCAAKVQKSSVLFVGSVEELKW
jgi:hypothetical protein